jgi:hypothetical protein
LNIPGIFQWHKTEALQKDHILVGIVAAIIFPVAFWLGLNFMDDNLVGKELFGNTFAGFSEPFIATLSICANFLPFFIYMRARKDHSMQGVGMVTVVLALVVAVKYFL